MASPQDPGELALVIKAVTCGTTGCCEWEDSAMERFRRFSPVRSLDPESLRGMLTHSVSSGTPVIQVEETREVWKKRRFFNRFYYKVLVPITGLTHGLFVELVLMDDDPDVPSVVIVNAHEQLP